jgi:hypothetical protein
MVAFSTFAILMIICEGEVTWEREEEERRVSEARQVPFIRSNEEQRSGQVNEEARGELQD